MCNMSKVCELIIEHYLISLISRSQRNISKPLLHIQRKRTFGNHFFEQTQILDVQLMTYLIYYQTNYDLIQHIHLNINYNDFKNGVNEKDKDRREKQEIRLEGNKKGTDELQLLNNDFHLITHCSFQI